MRWKGRRQSTNVEDRRGMRVPGGRRGGVSCLGLIIVLAIAYFTGINPQSLLGVLDTVEQMAPPPSAHQAPAGPPPADDPQAQFVGVVLADTEDVWNQVLQGRYQEPTLVLFDGRVASA
jgi:predicted metalloprotease